MYKEAIRPAWAEINLSNLEHNIKQIKNKVGDTEIFGVIKADGYGHGAVMCARCLAENGVKTFAVATLQEGIHLRENGFNEDIVILGLTPDMYIATAIEYGFTPVVCTTENALKFNNMAKEQNKIIDVYIAVDTGMGRIGILADDVVWGREVVAFINDLSNINVKGMFSHMATADAYDQTFSKIQEQKFNRFVEYVQNSGIDIQGKTLANSASIMQFPTIYYDAVRPGIILYGCYPSEEVDKNALDLKPVMSIKANIVYIKEVPQGYSIGYGRKFIASRPSKIATIALGYADGYPRSYSKDAYVIVSDKLCKIAGNICMDQCMIDVTDVDDVKLGDEVIVMGQRGNLKITAEDIASSTGTINYEICCAFGQRLPKVYVK